MNEADLDLVESCIGETRLSFSLRLAWKVIGEKDDEIERLRGILSHVRLTDQLQAEESWRAEQPAGDPSP